MLDDFSRIVEPEDINPGPVAIAGPMLVAVKHDVVVFTNHTFELDALAWILHGPSVRSYSTNAALPSATIGLCCVYVAPIMLIHGFGWAALVEHQIVEGFSLSFCSARYSLVFPRAEHSSPLFADKCPAGEMATAIAFSITGRLVPSVHEARSHRNLRSRFISRT